MTEESSSGKTIDDPEEFQQGVGEENKDLYEGTNVADTFTQHGGDPRDLDLGKSLLVGKLPSAFLSDEFEVFCECVYELLSEEFKITREAVEKIVRIPRLQSNADIPENALRAIVMFKSRVHKHRVVAQKKLATLDGTLIVEPIEEIPLEMLECEDVVIADEVGDDDHSIKADTEEDNIHFEDDEDFKTHHVTKESQAQTGDKPEVVKQFDIKKDGRSEIKEAKADKTDDKLEKKEERPKKAYIDEDVKAPFEIQWDGAPEFQWKICSVPGDSRRLTLENLFYCDLRNPFIYRVMVKAESVDISFPMRFNLQGNKQMYGKVVLNFQYAAEVMQEAIKHLIYVRCAEGRRIKVYLPQTPQSVKQKDELEEKLGRVIQPTPRMHQLILKILPTEEYSIADVKSWFPESSDNVTNWEQTTDEIGQNLGIVTFATPDAAVLSHSSHTFLNVATSTDKTARVHVYMRGVEAHFGSLLTRWDQKRAREFYGEPVSAIKRSIADSRAVPAKRPRGNLPSRGVYRGSSRGYSSSPNTRGRGNYTSYREPAPFASASRDSYGKNRNDETGWRNNYQGSQPRYNDSASRFPQISTDSQRREYYGSSNYTRR